MNELGEKKRRLDIIEESSNIKHKKNKKHKKKDKTVALTSQYGSKGIIQKSDFYTKVAEFTAWAREVKNIAIDSLAGRDQKILFEEFREDFNTATLPGKKFYNLEKWELKQRAVHDEYATFNFKNGICF